MKRIALLLLCAILMLTGCTPEKNTPGTVPPVVPDTLPTDLPITEDQIIFEPENSTLLAVSVPAETESFCLEDGTELFSYTAQHMQLILPNEYIADKVILDFLNRIDTARADSESVLIAAQHDYQADDDWIPYFYQIVYSPVRIDHSVLSLFGIRNIYSGATHGSLSCVAVNYDLTNGNILTLGSIMHPDASKEDFITIILEKLSLIAEESELFHGYEDGVRSRLGGDENLYEDFYFTSTGLCFYFAPYEIAPYASGIITVEIPYSELTGLIYDGYFPAEREYVQGKLHSAAFMDTDMEQFNNMVEVKLTTGEENIVVYPDGKVEDIRITVPGDGFNLPDYTVFAALEMSNKNAVILHVAEKYVDQVSVSYMSENNPHVFILSK